jgi:hypothetical protein
VPLVEESRYAILAGTEERCLICAGQENIRVRVERGLSVNETGRKRYPERTIFLDGVYSGPPFCDNKVRQYSLDHHAGCVRAFTLASCEQAAVMIRQGLPLKEGNWTIYVNEPDLDAVLAAWVLLNHAELLRDEAELLWAAMPLIRVEGIIDAHGFDMGAVSGLPRGSYEEQKRQIDDLLAAESSFKACSAWAGIDVVQYTRDLLYKLDAVLYPEDHLSHLLSVEELCKAPLHGGRFALLCRSTQGIYQVETLLKQRHEKQLGIIVLDMGGGRFTVRQVDPFLDPNLDSLYRLLNQKDPEAGREGGLDNLWGGSDGIGGSPRRTGSGLSGEEVLRLVQRVYSKGWVKGWLGGLVRRLRS